MDKYVVVFKQAARGCIDTISCGTLVVEVEGVSMKNALANALERHGWRNDYDHFDKEKYAMHSVKIFKVSEENETMFEEHRERVQELHSKSQKENELAEKRRLFAEFQEDLKT